MSWSRTQSAFIACACVLLGACSINLGGIRPVVVVHAASSPPAEEDVEVRFVKRRPRQR